MSGQTVLFVEDDEALRFATVQALELAGLSVRPFAGAEAALAALPADFDGVIVSDIRMPRIDGLQLLARVRALDKDLPVILVTGHGDVPMAVSALRDGAFDFLPKPFATDHLVATIARALERRALVIENRRLRAAVEAGEADSPLVGESAAMVRVRATIGRLAAADLDVLVEGETGTGKELAALMLHRLGPRRGKPFVAVDCTALTGEGGAADLFGHAADSVAHTRLSRVGAIAASSGGTLLLDAVDDLSPAIQAALSRVIEEREVQPIGAERAESVNLRVVATSRGDLAAAVSAGRFRADLYHRLAMTRLHLPPLREREHDRMLLFVAFVDQAREALARPDYAIGEAERHHVLAHGWPGNVRELRNYAFACVLSADDAPAEGPQDLPSRVAEFETRVIVDALRASAGNVVKAVELLGIPRKTLYYKLGRYGIDPDAFRNARS
ncbi:sigma-54-dependent transcriptional regulator [Sphingomonas melonis]|uniref:Two-component system C4-dicarboxylate transport response regulator DctD n=1 Tax=Sphingomonas melonis TaxID=152682 RepID=A0A7Y9FLQ1_9SPHN|nr:sigma-54 dependent transcriptional regulator [Sphingomonas melonis]NYD89443.1 two-component system C4-dicarboxylate transport response regulator DctD [Sphingomonas melonis]